MAAKNELRTDTAENFVTSIFKFSVGTLASIVFYGLYFVITNFFVGKAALGQIGIFVAWSNTLMTLAVVGLDQALMRFFHEPPGGGSKDSLFRHCFYFSVGVLALGMVVGIIFATPIYQGLGFKSYGLWIVPMLFLNAFFLMVARYFNILYRMEMKVRAYTWVFVCMQFFYTLFYLTGAFFPNPDLAMVLFSLGGLGGLAVVLLLIRRKTLRPQLHSQSKGMFRAILPFGFAMAPSAVFVAFTGAVPLSIIGGLMNEDAIGVYRYAYQMSNVVTMVQGGFAAFWTPYVYKNYKTDQPRIFRVHEYINLIILAFFSVLVIFEDVLFWVFRNYRESMTIFPLLMLSAVFNILTETTVQGNAIARRPIFDTIGIVMSGLINFGLCFALIPRLGLVGAGIAIVIGSAASYVFRTLIAQRFYRTIPYPGKTALALVVAVGLTAAGTVWHGSFLLKGAAGLVAIGVYCLLYRKEVVRCAQIGLSILKSVGSRLTKKGA